ncbi:MAG: hydrogenase maturation nickel metallochaperone HypA [Deltaproteobacteria bacterium]|nr:hydrogenase maturation nickel metallochaperone HypA [Deltaproteobacteria bacterium]MBZ0219400.1 hydrogenase maturation nickel metallochaperone HypA [Deltaproteobacteria bacterium]
MSITKNILETVRAEMEKAALKELRSVRIRVGELTAVEPEALRFCFEASIKGTSFEGAALDIEEAPLTGKCEGCGLVFRISLFERTCPGCGGSSVEIAGGNELDIVSMEGV